MTQRRILGGARREASLRVVLTGGEASQGEIEGWTLNLSRGGVRIVVEDPVFVAMNYDVKIGEEAPRPARVVWVREETDGRIVGLEFLDVEGGAVPPSTASPG